jgi:hypothetical protein
MPGAGRRPAPADDEEGTMTETRTTGWFEVRRLTAGHSYCECYACWHSVGTVHGSETLFHIGEDGKLEAFCDHCWRSGPQYAAEQARRTARWFRGRRNEVLPAYAPPGPAWRAPTPEESDRWDAEMVETFSRRAAELERLECWPCLSVVSCTYCNRRYRECDMWYAPPVGPCESAVTLPPTFICPLCRERGVAEVAFFLRLQAETLEREAKRCRAVADLVEAATW